MKLLFLSGILYFVFFFYPQKIFAATVVINEFVPHPTTGNNDWIEVYNPSDQSAIVDNWKLVDSTSAMTTLSGSIDAKGFKVVEVSNRLNNSGDTITLKDETDTIADTYKYTSDPGVDVSIVRNPGGVGSIALLAQATKGSQNSPAQPTATLTTTDTPIPTTISTLTHTPTHTKTSTPAPTSKPTSTPESVATATSTIVPATAKSLPSIFVSPTQTEDLAVDAESAPTAILGDMVTASPSAMPTDVVEEISTSVFDFPKLAMGIGFVFLVGSGILAFRSWKARNNNEE